MPARVLETYYNGYKFRSRLEARWAVFFDAVGLEFLYENEGFEVGDGIFYLPDFYLQKDLRFIGEKNPQSEIWVEIKPTTELSVEERKKIAGFVKSTGKGMLLIAGDPGTEASIRFIKREENDRLSASDVKWIELQDGQVGLIGIDQLDGIKDREKRETAERQINSKILTGAYEKARSERFERKNGESRCARCGSQFRPQRHYHKLCNQCYHQDPSYRKAKAPSTAVSLPPAIKWIVPTILVLVIVILLSWATYQIINLPNTLFKVDADAPKITATEPAAESTLAPTLTVPAELTPVNRNDQQGNGIAECRCTENLYNCPDFASKLEAQTCYEFCFSSSGDVHYLDEDGDGRACEALVD